MPDPLIVLPADTDRDPLEGMQSPLDASPNSAEEASRRQHIAEQVLTVLDTLEDATARENALRHILICDPARAMGLLVQLAVGGLETLEGVFGDPPGSVLAELRRTNQAARRQA